MSASDNNINVNRRGSPQLGVVTKSTSSTSSKSNRHHPHHHQTATSDSDASVETNSLSADSITGADPITIINHTQTNDPNLPQTAISTAPPPAPPTATIHRQANNLSGPTTTNHNDNSATEKSARKKTRRSSEWEIMEGLRDGQRFDVRPNPFSGYLHKKRKWPLKGWHKRYFLVEKGILIYGKSPSDISRGKIHGSLDIGLSVISTKAKRKRIDIDAEEFIYHLKAKTDGTFNDWVHQLTAHRLYRQHVLTFGTAASGGGTLKSLLLDGGGGGSGTSPVISRDGSLQRGLKPAVVNAAATVVTSATATAPSTTEGAATGGGSSTNRLAVWLQESNASLEQIQKETSTCEQHLTHLTALLQRIENSTVNLDESSAATVASSSVGIVKKDRKKFGLKKKKSNTTIKSTTSSVSSVDLIGQQQNANVNVDNTSPVSVNSFTSLSMLPQMVQQSETTLIDDNHLIIKEEFICVARNALTSIRNVIFGLNSQREHIKTITIDCHGELSTPNNLLHTRNSFNQLIQQNIELKNRLLRIHDTSDLGDMSLYEVAAAAEQMRSRFGAGANSLSYSSSCVSGVEFFDAAEDLPSTATTILDSTKPVVQRPVPIPPTTANTSSNEDEGHEDEEVRTRSESSSEEEEEEEAASLTSGEDEEEEEEEGSIISSESEDLGAGAAEARNIPPPGGGSSLTGRRTILPAPRPITEGLSLWNLLSRNIGKDLSKISMPVALNEPLNILQRLCEELEYSELLDKAAHVQCPYERMTYVAAFAVSAYASTLSRAGNKPFNPLLGETYECIRADKGFKFVAEQVSHHPPISACYAVGERYEFWQDARVKTKFWGKSMEFQPLGSVHLRLKTTGDMYTWNKVTTCVHNLFSGQRWVDQYGELSIVSDSITCKLTFSKASYWSGKRHEVVGAVFDANQKPVRRLFGNWSESMYSGVPPTAHCIWRAGTLPEDHERYYGFTRFAIELNELRTDDVSVLPPTDTRLRPDQRALEEGDLEAAERLKMQLESDQRERRGRNDRLGVTYEPKWFNSTCDSWQYNDRYWDVREAAGFQHMTFEALW